MTTSTYNGDKLFSGEIEFENCENNAIDISEVLNYRKNNLNNLTAKQIEKTQKIIDQICDKYDHKFYKTYYNMDANKKLGCDAIYEQGFTDKFNLFNVDFAWNRCYAKERTNLTKIEFEKNAFYNVHISSEKIAANFIIESIRIIAKIMGFRLVTNNLTKSLEKPYEPKKFGRAAKLNKGAFDEREIKVR